MIKHLFIDTESLLWLILLHDTVKMVKEERRQEPARVFEELAHHEHELAMRLKLSFRLEVFFIFIFVVRGLLALILSLLLLWLLTYGRLFLSSFITLCLPCII